MIPIESPILILAGALMVGTSLVTGYRLQVAIERHARLRLPRDTGAWLGLVAGLIGVYVAL
jgi:hypothetical protein